MSWTQPICMACWDREYPGRAPSTVLEADKERCCLCGSETRQGIYMRRDPKTVPYPTEGDE